VLLSVVYRYSNLSWVMMSRINFRIYVSCHWAQDCMHLLQVLQSPQEKKWCRQGFNQTCCIYRSASEYNQNAGMKLSDLPESILKSTPTSFCLGKVRDFLRSDIFMRQYRRSESPLLFPTLLGDTINDMRGWRVFGSIDPSTGTCRSKKRRKCPCKSIVEELEDLENLENLQNLQSLIPKCCPTILQNTKLMELFQPFIDYMRKNPNVRFFAK